MPSEPLVSVIMPVYNAGRYLRPAIESVLAQTHRNLELIIVDDGSTDGCMETVTDLLADPRVRVMRQANAGKPVAMNRALAAAHGEYFALNDADDISHPERIERLLAVMEANPDLACVFSGYQLIIDDRRMAPISHTKSREECKADIDGLRMPSHDPTGFWRMSMVKAFAYDADLPIGEGYDFILRVGEKHPMMVTGDVLYDYRVHPSSITKRDPGKRDAYVRKARERAWARRGVTPPVNQPASGSSDPDNGLAVHFLESVRSLRRLGRRGEAMREGWNCVRLRPTRVSYFKPLVCSMLPGSLGMGALSSDQ